MLNDEANMHIRIRHFFYIQAEVTLGNTRPHSDTASNNLDCSFMVYTSSKSKI